MPAISLEGVFSNADEAARRDAQAVERDLNDIYTNPQNEWHQKLKSQNPAERNEAKKHINELWPKTAALHGEQNRAPQPKQAETVPQDRAIEATQEEATWRQQLMERWGSKEFDRNVKAYLEGVDVIFPTDATDDPVATAFYSTPELQYDPQIADVIAKVGGDLNGLGPAPASDRVLSEEQQKELLDKLDANYFNGKAKDHIGLSKIRKAVGDDQARVWAIGIARRIYGK